MVRSHPLSAQHHQRKQEQQPASSWCLSSPSSTGTPRVETQPSAGCRPSEAAWSGLGEGGHPGQRAASEAGAQNS